jgi:NTE family protein
VEKKEKKINWWQFSAKVDHYIPMGKHFSLGLTAEGVYSTHPLENNYMETLLMCPKFVPTKHSLTVFNTAFSSNSYLAAGIKPIVSINKFLQLRFEGFFFAPHRAIIPTATFKPEYEKNFSKLYAMAEGTFAVQLRYITAGLYANWYSYPEKNYNFGLNIGYLIFHDKLIE